METTYSDSDGDEIVKSKASDIGVLVVVVVASIVAFCCCGGFLYYTMCKPSDESKSRRHKVRGGRKSMIKVREIELQEKQLVHVEEAEWATATSNPMRGNMNSNPLFRGQVPSGRVTKNRNANRFAL